MSNKLDDEKFQKVKENPVAYLRQRIEELRARAELAERKLAIAMKGIERLGYCPTCDGDKTVLVSAGAWSMPQPETCWECKGEGLTVKAQAIKAEVEGEGK